jgi:hypothetical protein
MTTDVNYNLYNTTSFRCYHYYHYNYKNSCQYNIVAAVNMHDFVRSATITVVLPSLLRLTAATAAATAAASIDSVGVLWYMLVNRPNSSLNRAVFHC